MADVNLSVEVQSRGVAEATAAVERLTASGKKFALLKNDITQAGNALSASVKGSTASMGAAANAMKSLQGGGGR